MIRAALLALPLMLAGCVGSSDLAAMISAAAKDPAVGCAWITTPYGAAGFMRSGASSSSATCGGNSLATGASATITAPTAATAGTLVAPAAPVTVAPLAH